MGVPYAESLEACKVHAVLSLKSAGAGRFGICKCQFARIKKPKDLAGDTLQFARRMVICIALCAIGFFEGCSSAKRGETASSKFMPSEITTNHSPVVTETVPFKHMLMFFEGTRAGSYYVQAEFMITGSGPGLARKIETKDNQIREAICLAIYNKLDFNLFRPNMEDAFKQLVRQCALEIMISLLGKDTIQDLTITKFVCR